MVYSVLCLIKPKFHYADFHRNFPSGKVADTDHESRRQTILTCQDVCNRVRDKSATNQFVLL